MKTYRFRNKDIEVPECFDELKPSQYIIYLRLASAWCAGVISAELFAEKWLSELVGLNGTSYRLLVQEYISEAEGIGAEVLPGFIDGGRPQLRTCRNLLPEYDGHSGPGDYLYGMTFGDFTECVTLLELASADDDPDSCYRKIAMIMYGYVESDFISPVLIYHSVLMLNNVWSSLQTDPVEIDGRKVDLSIIFKGSGSTKPDDNTGWQGITMEVAQAGLFGHVDDVRRAALWDVLLYLYRCKFESDHSNNH